MPRERALPIDDQALSGVPQRALTAPGSLTPPEVLGLQRLVGNKAVSRLLLEAAGPRGGPDETGVQVVQRHIKNKNYVEYGGTNANGVGTTMVAELWPGYSPGPGSKPSVEPSWWPHAPDVAASFFEGFMVQGRLLNHQIGGPGNTMENLTPITKSANKMHETKIESAVKTHVKSAKYVVDYHVDADYSSIPKGSEIAPKESAAVQKHIDKKYAGRLPAKIAAEFTAWNQLPTGKWVQLGDRWEIGNEGKEIV